MVEIRAYESGLCGSTTGRFVTPLYAITQIESISFRNLYSVGQSQPEMRGQLLRSINLLTALRHLQLIKIPLITPIQVFDFLGLQRRGELNTTTRPPIRILNFPHLKTVTFEAGSPDSESSLGHDHGGTFWNDDAAQSVIGCVISRNEAGVALEEVYLNPPERVADMISGGCATITRVICKVGGD